MVVHYRNEVHKIQEPVQRVKKFLKYIIAGRLMIGRRIY